MEQNEPLAQLALQIALANVGQKELTGHNDGKFVNMVQEFVGGKSEDGEPWCACFRSWCIGQAATKLLTKPIIPKSDSSTYLYQYAFDHGLLMLQPIPGCTGLLRGTGGTQGKTHHHTFTVISVDHNLGVVHSVDGNWGNSVAVTSHPIAACDFMACI